MSIGTLSQVWTHYQNGSSVQTPGVQANGNAGSQSYADWMASLMSATGSASASGGATTPATLSDQMQALLVQLQGGATTAPQSDTGTAADANSGTAVASVTPSSSGPASGAAGVSGHHHHHHHGGSGSTDDTEDDLATDIAGDLSGNDAASAGTDTSSGSGLLSGLGQAAGTALTDIQQLLKTYGAAAIQGAASGAVIAAI